MAGTPREWVDIDTAWLQNYLQEHDLASEFDLDDVLLGAQVSWTLSAEEWARLRGAWQKQQPTGEVQEDAAQAPADEEWPAAAETGLESAEEETADVQVQAAEVRGVAAQKPAESAKEPRVAVTEPVKQLDEEQRMYELTQNALSDWGAFKELFRYCPDSAGADAWETLADSPVALLKQAEKLISMQEARAEGQKQEVEREFEDDVTRAQNSITGYYLYCRKHRIPPSLEHLLDFLPVMRTGHSPEAVREAWRREAEFQKWEQG